MGFQDSISGKFHDDCHCKNDAEKCGLSCSGGTLKYIRGTYQQNSEPDIWRHGKIDAEEFFTDKQLPKLPLYYPDVSKIPFSASSANGRICNMFSTRRPQFPRRYRVIPRHLA